MGYGYPRILNWKSSHSPHYEDLETNVFESKKADRPVCVGNEEFKQPEDRHVVEQEDDASQQCIQSENRVHVDKVNENIEVSKGEEYQDIKMESYAGFIDSLNSDTIDDVIRSTYATKNTDESKAIIPYIGSSS
ncbi:hypothetical protein TorRG33x02_236140 [Trema orientale]|uniref:Uncharacterized protein n=1 Tax=Trema orientale TaxID=63057 RepID=A0A2P5E1C8_TREOI|nr:hypothetical protein TorRG33x02_236140 [Trema orientale]